MANQSKPVDKLIYDLKERAKELNCLYEVQELISNPELNIEDVCQGIVEAIPPGWQYPDICQAMITYAGKTYQTSGFVETPWVQKADIVIQDESVGRINVSYTSERPLEDEGPFLKEERKLIETIAEQLGNHILHQQLKEVFEEQKKSDLERKAEWWVILNLLKRTDPNLLMRISRRMINYLYWNGINEAEQLLERFNPAVRGEQDLIDVNKPFQFETREETLALSDEVYELAGRYLGEQAILDRIQKWIREDQSGFLVNVIVNPSSSLMEISSAIERFHHLGHKGLELSDPRGKSVLVSLIRRLLSEQSPFIEVAKRYLEVDDFNELIKRIIYPTESHGKLGGKGAGLFIATQILNYPTQEGKLLRQVKTPKTWYIASDSLFHFMGYNNLEDIVEQKYKDLNQVRQEYPYVVHVFKNSALPPEMLKGLSVVLDEFEDVPLIVRSSSLLEDSLGMSFAGKYKSLFIANQGSKEERLVAITDAIMEVYASMFGPDPIEYRLKHGLLDHHEEMGIMIQEVVGARVGRYYFPAFSGVAFSNNEFRWSSRIKLEDGLVRIVPGLGTRAVDRLSDDYPVLVAPGKPGLRVNVSIDEIVRYSPKKIDVINLDTGSFETIDFRSLIRECGHQYPGLDHIVSVVDHDHIQQPKAVGNDYEKDHFVVTFEGLFSKTPFLKMLGSVINELQEKFNHPVDVEFAFDGQDYYLLQCRAQSYREESKPASIPGAVPEEKVVFTADRYVTNGTISNITHIVYVDTDEYSEISNYQDMLAVGRVVGRLNKILPKRQFILMGPGRWGSRGDRRLGVGVTYSDINNTAMLVEVARIHGDYVPEPSFGTHFFQDLVESNIRYLPLYPDDSKVVFNRRFLKNSKSVLQDILPDYAHLNKIVRVIDIRGTTGGQVLQVLMNAESKKAMALLTDPPQKINLDLRDDEGIISPEKTDVHWRWRLSCVEGIAAQLDPERFGVKSFYIFGSVKDGTAGPQSDIDILIHFRGTTNQRMDLLTWLEGWSLCLSQVNLMRTGYETRGLLNVHIITDEDIEKRTSYALKIGAVTDAARPLPMGTSLGEKR